MIQHVPQDPWGWALHTFTDCPTGQETKPATKPYLCYNLGYTAQKGVTFYAHTYPLTTPALKA